MARHWPNPTTGKTRWTVRRRSDGRGGVVEEHRCERCGETAPAPRPTPCTPTSIRRP